MMDLDNLRQEIDRLDHKLIETLRDRFLAVDKIGQIKKEQNIAPLDASRWQKVLDSRLSWADELGVDREFLHKVLDLIHEEALKIENEKTI